MTVNCQTEKAINSKAIKNDSQLSPAALAALPEDHLSDLYAMTAALDYSFYVEYVHRGVYTHGAHTKYICSVLERLERGEIKRLMIFLPPRFSKSFTVTETFPSWFVGRDPSRRVIAIAYGDSLSKRYGKQNRSKIEEYGGAIFGVKLQKGSETASNWKIENHQGQMLSAGIGGPITGEGADLLIIDDPIKNRQEANSPTYREMVWNEWKSTFLTRLSPKGSVILILTRWHEDDLAGRLLSEEPGKWTVLALPCLAEDDDPLGRAPGAPLWPEYGFDEEWALSKKKEVGSYAWAALYQQRPAPLEGGIIKRWWWRFWRPAKVELPPVSLRGPDGVIEVEAVPLPHRFDQVIQSWDMTFKDTKGSSYVAGQIWGRQAANKFLLDQVRDRMDFVRTVAAVENLTYRWPGARSKLIEDAANGPAVIATLRSRISGLIPIKPEGSKESRAHAISPEVESGNVYLPHPAVAPWVREFIEEATAFPNSAYKDQVDAMTQALNRFPRWDSRPTVRMSSSGERRNRVG